MLSTKMRMIAPKPQQMQSRNERLKTWFASADHVSGQDFEGLTSAPRVAFASSQ